MTKTDPEPTTLTERLFLRFAQALHDNPGPQARHDDYLKDMSRLLDAIKAEASTPSHSVEAVPGLREALEPGWTYYEEGHLDSRRFVEDWVRAALASETPEPRAEIDVERLRVALRNALVEMGAGTSRDARYDLGWNDALSAVQAFLDRDAARLAQQEGTKP